MGCLFAVLMLVLPVLAFSGGHPVLGVFFVVVDFLIFCVALLLND